MHRWAMRGWIVVVLWLAACQGAAPPPRQATGKDPGVLAAEALTRGDYAKAADLYRAALAATPDSVPLHYGLGVSASHLGRRDEAIRELTWVLGRGEPSSTEVQAARRWLASVGALPRSADPARSADQSPEPSATAARLQGQVRAEDDGSPMRRMQLLLMEYPSKENYFRLRTDEQGRYTFAQVPPGTYKLTERVAGKPTWRLRVELKAGQDATMDLGPGNSTKVRDDFPDAPQR